MRERIKAFLKWVSSNIAWDVFKTISGWLFSSLLSYVGSDFIIEKIPKLVSNANIFLDSVGISTTGYSLVFGLLFFIIFGVISFISSPLRLIWDYVVKSDKPKLTQLNDGVNAIVRYEDFEIGIGIISIKNDPGRRSDKSTAYNVSARIEYFDRKDKHILTVNRGFWTSESAEKYFQEYGKIKQCDKVDFYTYNHWSLPVAYKKVENDEKVYAYDPTSPLFSKELGRLPIKIMIHLDGENYKSKKPLKIILMPQPRALKGFWIQKR